MFAAAGLCACTPTPPGGGDTAAAGADLPARLQHDVPALLEDHDVPGAQIALVEGARVTWEAGFGVGDTVAGTPVRRDTLFNIASLSKPLTAWGVMHLVATERVGLDDAIGRYVPEWRQPAGNDGVTVRRLLSHTAALSMPSIPGFPPDLPLPDLADTLAGNYTRSMYADPGTAVEFIGAPGERFVYSGGGYVLLQALVENVSGRTLDGYMKTHVLVPLGMQHTHYGLDVSPREQLAAPHRNARTPAPVFRFRGTGGAGVYSTAGDVARFVAANLVGANQDVLSPAAVAAMLTPVVETGADDLQLYESMGLGFFLADLGGGRTLISHTGGNIGWRALFAGVRETGHGIVVLTNGDNGEAVLTALLCAWAETSLGAGVLRDCD